MSFTHITVTKITDNHKCWACNFGGNSLDSVMVEQTILQAALTSTETFDGAKSKFEAWMEALENVAQLSGQNTVCCEYTNIVKHIYN